jgi:cysteine desulfurase/selenocysteine lyase
MDANVIRDFPILKRRENGGRLVYLDNAATTHKPRTVLEAMDAFYEQSNANIHRGLYPLSAAATELYEGARQKVARFINAAADHVIFTSGATESINIVAHSWGLEHLKAGDEILLTPLEHHANIVPWQEIARLTGAKLVYCGLNADFTIDIADLKQKMSSKTKILAITHVSNVLGAVTPLADIVPYAKRHGVVVLVDGAQAVPHMRVDVRALGCDAYAFSGHKMLGPTGTGVLYLSSELMRMRPCKTGGDMIDDVTEQGAVFAEKEPRRFEAGTPNIAGAIGLAAAVEYLEAIGIEKVHAHELHLLEQAWKGLSAIKGVTLYGPPPSPERAGVLAFAVAGVHPHDVAQILADEGVCIRTGKLCAHPLHYRMKLPEGTCRASFYLYNTEEDVEALIHGVKKVIEVFH